jgi:hypothetical protein
MRKPGSPPKTSRRQAAFLKNRLKKLGFGYYIDYLRSPQWASVGERYRTSESNALTQKCVVCADPKFELHHRTYQRLGAELLSDLVPLCRLHHEELHERGLNLWDGPKILRKEFREVMQGGRQPQPERARQWREAADLTPLVLSPRTLAAHAARGV